MLIKTWFLINHIHFWGNKLSKNKGFSDTSANRYSLALFELASESNLLTQVEENSTSILNLISNNEDFKNFISFLITKRRFFYVEQILKNFKEICSEKRGELKAEIKSAKELTQEEINKITEELSNNFKSKIKLNYNYDKSLIGGLVVQVGSTMIDTSIKKKLQQIETRMIEA